MGHGLAATTAALTGFGLTWVAQSTALLALGLLAGRLLKSTGPAVQSAVYRTALAAILVCPVATALLAGAGYEGWTLRLPSSGSLDGPEPASLAVVAPQSRPWTAGAHDRSPEQDATPAGPVASLPARASGVVVPSNASSTVPGPSPARPPTVPSRSVGLAQVVVLGLAVWLLGSSVMVLRLLVGHRRMARLRASAVPAEPSTEALCRDLAGRMRLGAPAVLRSPFLFSPCLDGLRRPAILLPDDVGENLRETFVHELAHLARRDGLWNLLRRYAAAVLWVQPLLWVLSRRLEESAEEVCDDYVVQFGADRARYAGHLLELAGRALPPAGPAGVGMVSLRSLLARRIVRILDPTRSLSTRAGTRAVLSALVTGLAGTFLAGLLGVGGGKQEVLAQAQARAKGASTESEPNDKVLRGQVVGPDGKPMAGAKVIAARGRRILNGIGNDHSENRPHEFLRGTAGPDGRFEVDTGKRVEDGTAAKAAPADVPIRGRIVDLEGRPVAGVSVTVTAVRIPKSGDLTPVLDGLRKGEPPWVAYRQIDWDRKAPETAPREATTDRDGRFRLDGQGAERVVELTLQGPTIAHTTINVATRALVPFPARGFHNTHGPGTEMIHGADFTFTAAPSRPIEGFVKDDRTGQPLADAEVRSYRFAGSDFVGTMTLKTRTDRQGRFLLSGLPRGKGNVLIVVPNDEQPYLMQEVPVPDPPGVDPVRVDLAMQRGVWIEGKVTEEATGKPVTGAWLHYMPFRENTFAQAHPVFDSNGNTNGVGFQDRYQTKADGAFRLVGLPGRAIVGAVVHGKSYLQGTGSESIKGLNKSGHFETYRNPINPGKLWPTVMKEIDPPADAEVVHLDFQVTTGPSVRLKVVDADGNPMTGVQTRGRGGRSSYEREDMTTAEGEVTNLMPGEERIVLLRHEGRKLGKVVRVHKGNDEKGPVVVTLEPLGALTGRVADADGNPVSGATVRPDVLPHGEFGLSLPQVATDEDGRFRVPDVPTGCNYALAVDNGAVIKKRQFAFSAKDIAVKPGEMTEVGEIRFKND